MGTFEHAPTLPGSVWRVLVPRSSSVAPSTCISPLQSRVIADHGCLHRIGLYTATWFERKLDFFEHFKRPKFFILGKFCTHPPRAHLIWAIN
jgi:hypothetical protein